MGLGDIGNLFSRGCGSAGGNWLLFSGSWEASSEFRGELTK